MATSETTAHTLVESAHGRSLPEFAHRAWVYAGEHRFALTLAGVTLFTRLFWAAVIPILQTPDETAHFAYIQNLGERLALTSDEPLSKEIGAVEVLTGLDRVPFHGNTTQVFAAGSLDGPNEDAVEALASELRDEKELGRPNSAVGYPTTYYLVGSVIYRAIPGDLFTKVFALRALSSLISTATMVISYLTLRRFFSDDRLAKAAALIIALSPMYIFAGMSVNPDVLVFLLFSFFLYLCTCSLEGGLSARTNLWIAATIVAGLWVKQTFLIATPMYAILLGYLYVKRSLCLSDALKYAVMTAGLVAVLAGGLYASGAVKTSAEYPGRVASDRSIGDFIGHLRYRWFEYSWTFDMFWGYFGWLDTPLSQRVFNMIRFGCGMAAIGLVFHLGVSVLQRKPDFKALFYLSICVVYVAAYVVLNYIRITGGEFWLLQGRYFFPMIVPIIALLLRGLLWYAPTVRARDVVLVGAVVGILWLNVDALFGYVVPRYYL